MAVSLVVPVQALFGAAYQPPPAPQPPPPPACAPCATSQPPLAEGHGFVAAECMRADRMLEERAIAEIERLRNELGASDMALEAARSELHRERIESALDRRATVAEADAAAARHAPSGESFSQPVPGTIAAITPDNGLSAGRDVTAHDDGAPGAPSAHRGTAPLVGAVETIVVRTRSLIDLFA